MPPIGKAQQDAREQVCSSDALLRGQFLKAQRREGKGTTWMVMVVVGAANRDYPAHHVWTALNTKLLMLSNNLLNFVLIKDLYICQSVLLTIRNYGVATLS